MMKNVTKLACVALAVVAFSCGKDDDATAPVAPNPNNTGLVNNGAGGVTAQTDTSDTDLLSVVQAIPSTPGVYPANLPIMFFLDDKVYLPSVENNLRVTQDGTPVVGKITVNESSNGYAILTFTPASPFGANKMIEATLKVEMEDDGGNGLPAEFKISYTTGGNGGAALGPFDTNGSFESDTAGVAFIGDGNISTGTGDIQPQHLTKFGIITTGNQLVSGGSAVGGETSMMILGPINSNLSSLTFQYDFASTEFNEYVNSQFDDVAMVTVTGPNGSYTTMLTSVNIVGTAGNTQCNGCANMPDNGDSYAGHTGWTAKNINFAAVGSPAYVVFTVTDVGDGIYSSALAVDNITF